MKHDKAQRDLDASERYACLEQCPNGGRDCSSTKAVIGLHDGTLPESERDQIEQHMHRCGGCLTDLYFYSQVAETPVCDRTQGLLDRLVPSDSYLRKPCGMHESA